MAQQPFAGSNEAAGDLDADVRLTISLLLDAARFIDEKEKGTTVCGPSTSVRKSAKHISRRSVHTHLAKTTDEVSKMIRTPRSRTSCRRKGLVRVDPDASQSHDIAIDLSTVMDTPTERPFRHRNTLTNTCLDTTPIKAEQVPCHPQSRYSTNNYSIVNATSLQTPPKRTIHHRRSLTKDDPNETDDEILDTKGQPKTPKRVCKTTGKPFSPDTTVRSTPRKRAPPLAEYVQEQIPIPTCWQDVTAPDHELLRLKEQEGITWQTIRAAWKVATGQDVAASTLPNRYNRLKANLKLPK